jgi:hypothetical protein
MFVTPYIGESGGERNTFAISLKEQGKLVKEVQGRPVLVGKGIAVDSLLVARLDKGKIIEVWIKGSVTIS